MRGEARFRMTERLDPERYRTLQRWAQRSAEERYGIYEQLSRVTVPQRGTIPAGPPVPADTE
jgi:hypothetical protein